MKRLVGEHTYYRRARVPRETVTILRAQQDDKRHHCGDKLHGQGEVHPATAVAQGGGNEAANLQLLCHMCHVQIS